MGMKMSSGFTLTHQSEGCGMETDEMDDHRAGHGPVLDYEPCCEDQVLTFELDQQFKPVPGDFSDPGFVSGNISQPYFFILDRSSGFSFLIFTDTSPPLPEVDFQVMYQTFLI